jgi:hypothetical protein
MVPTRRETIQCMSPIVVPFRWFAAEKESPFPPCHDTVLCILSFWREKARGEEGGKRGEISLSEKKRFPFGGSNFRKVLALGGHRGKREGRLDPGL